MLTECANVGHWQRKGGRQAALDVAHVKDGNSFATRLSKILIFGEHDKPWISLPKGKSNCPPPSHCWRQRLLSWLSNGCSDFQIREMESSWHLIRIYNHGGENKTFWETCHLRNMHSQFFLNYQKHMKKQARLNEHQQEKQTNKLEGQTPSTDIGIIQHSLHINSV